MQDPRFLGPLEKYRAKIPDTDWVGIHFVLKVEATCGSREAITMLARRIVEDQSKVLRESEDSDAGGYAALTSLNRSSQWDSLRTRIVRRIKRGYHKYHAIPSKIGDTVLRTALSEPGLNDWYVLYLLARIEEPQAQDRERIRIIWDKKDEQKRLVAADVLWFWKDSKTLLELREQCKDEGVGSEIQRALNSIEKTTTTSKNR